MSNKLEQLLQKLCPEGVEYKTLGEIAVEMYRGAGIKRDQITDEGTPCVRYGEIYTEYGVWFDKCVSHTDAALITSKKYFSTGDILFAITGEKIEEIAKSCAYIGSERCLAGGDIVVMKHEQNPKYLAYALATRQAQKQKMQGKVKNKVVHSNVPSLKAIVVPLPPMEVQEEIVRILDKLSELTTELTSELEAELEARKKQYEYYRDSLLNFNNRGYNTLKLSELCNVYDSERKPVAKAFRQSGIYPYYGANGIQDYVSEYLFDGQYVLVGEDGSVMTQKGTPVVSWAEGKIWVNNHAHIISAKQGVLIRYLYHYLQTINIKKLVHGTPPKLTGNDFKSLLIPVPLLDEQQRIVDILDRFDTLCSDLTSGLPAEIEARRKQYEYYRDKLLTFQPLKQA